LLCRPPLPPFHRRSASILVGPRPRLTYACPVAVDRCIAPGSTAVAAPRIDDWRRAPPFPPLLPRIPPSRRPLGLGPSRSAQCPPAGRCLSLVPRLPRPPFPFGPHPRPEFLYPAEGLGRLRSPALPLSPFAASPPLRPSRPSTASPASPPHLASAAARAPSCRYLQLREHLAGAQHCLLPQSGCRCCPLTTPSRNSPARPVAAVKASPSPFLVPDSASPRAAPLHPVGRPRRDSRSAPSPPSPPPASLLPALLPLLPPPVPRLFLPLLLPAPQGDLGNCPPPPSPAPPPASPGRRPPFTLAAPPYGSSLRVLSSCNRALTGPRWAARRAPSLPLPPLSPSPGLPPNCAHHQMGSQSAPPSLPLAHSEATSASPTWREAAYFGLTALAPTAL
jgi:hypothetical protein